MEASQSIPNFNHLFLYYKSNHVKFFLHDTNTSVNALLKKLRQEVASFHYRE